MTPARVHIVTVLYNSAAQLPGFLDCLTAQMMREWRLIAIDNASQDESRRLLEARHDTRIAIIGNAANRGFARATNQGLRVAMQDAGEIFVLMNNDTVFAPEFLTTMLAMRARLGAIVLAPRIMRAADPSQDWYAGGHLDQDWVFSSRHDAYDPSDPREWWPVDFASGCCLLLTRAVLDQIGLLDERFFVYWEDTDYCLRLKQHAVSIAYVPGLSMLHDAGASSGGEFSISYNRLYYRSYMQLLRKHFGMRVALRSAARVLLKEAARSGRDRRPVFRAGWAMVKGLGAVPRRTPAFESGSASPGDRASSGDRFVPAADSNNGGEWTQRQLSRDSQPGQRTDH
jgi:hypothetical protein